MRTLLPAALALLLLALPAAGADVVTVRLVVDTALPGAPALHDCLVSVPADATAADALDAALAQGCIREWSGTEYPGYGRFVDSIDHVRGVPVASYWQVQVNGVAASTGVDSTFLADADTLRFAYSEGASVTASWLVDSLLAPVRP